MTLSADDQKKAAALAAMDYVTDGMKLGLGTGSTAKHFVDFIGEKVKQGWKLICVPTSEATRDQALSLNVPLTTLDETPELDLTVDGADEFDAALTLVKGGGGALLREKIVAASSKRMVVIADASKQVENLGAFPLPIEVIPFASRSTLRKIEKAAHAAGCKGALQFRQRDGADYITDNGNLIIDCAFGIIPDAPKLANLLQAIPGVVEHGLFINMADVAILGTPQGAKFVKAKS